jgi:protein-S-isoprenylcysteine O-methyltransferase Ste14
MNGAIMVGFLAAGTALVVAVSWRSLRRRSSHGFFRFFAFEAILGLLALNLPHWFERPGSPAHLLSWVLLAASLLLAVHGVFLLRRVGRPAPPDPESPLFGIENTTALVTTGAYRFIRHPLYASLLCLAWGAALKSLSPLAAGLALVASGFLLATAKAEEAENVERFGQTYRDYMRRTRRFIPYLF